MGNTVAERSGAAGRPRRWLLLALTLALAACGSGDETAKSGDPVGDTAAAVQTAMATDACTGPPPAFKDSVFQGTWQGLRDSLTAHAVTFPEIKGHSDTARVRLCEFCDSVRVVIRSSNLTPCLQPGSLDGDARILGLLILLDPFAKQQGWDSISAGDTIFTFARNPAQSEAVLAYRHDDRVKLAPDTAWGFAYCEDGHHHTAPRAEWRDRNRPPGQGKEGEGETLYGWMACASGCCQFYSNPPDPGRPITTPPQADSSAPNTVGKGRNQEPGRNCVFFP
jgi:hypothetical protein